MNCDECAHFFKPLFRCINIRQVKEALLAATSQTVWVVWRGSRYPVESFSKVNYSWSLWARETLHSWADQMTLTGMRNELKRHENWEGLHNYSLGVHIELNGGKGIWANVLRVEETRMMPTMEDETEAEDITGEILIHVHTEEDVQLAWEAAQ